jgi:hypothetical protein
MRMRKHESYGYKYLIVFILTIIIFMFGVLLGNYFTEQKFKEIQTASDELRLQTASAELQYLLLLEQPCKYINSTPLTDELYKISERLDYMESDRGETDPEVLRLKNEYSILELRHWLFTMKTNQQCNRTQVPIMYFYSNVGDCPKCKEQGYTLTYLRRKYPDLRIYSFDIATNNPALETIKTIHHINSVPSMVLPDRDVGFTSLEDMEVILVGYNLTSNQVTG